MNQRILELAEQAGFMLWQDEPWNPGDIVDWAARYDDELAKFAELIVQECIDMIQPSNDRTADTNVLITKDKIKEHFGIE